MKVCLYLGIPVRPTSQNLRLISDVVSGAHVSVDLDESGPQRRLVLSFFLSSRVFR